MHLGSLICTNITTTNAKKRGEMERKSNNSWKYYTISNPRFFYFLTILQTPRKTEPFFSYVNCVMLVTLIGHHGCVLSCDFCEIIRRAIPQKKTWIVAYFKSKHFPYINWIKSKPHKRKMVFLSRYGHYGRNKVRSSIGKEKQLAHLVLISYISDNNEPFPPLM